MSYRTIHKSAVQFKLDMIFFIPSYRRTFRLKQSKSRLVATIAIAEVSRIGLVWSTRCIGRGEIIIGVIAHTRAPMSSALDISWAVFWSVFLAIVCPCLDMGLPAWCPQVVWCHWGEIESLSATLAQDGLAGCDQPGKNPLKYSATPGNWTQAMERTDIYSPTELSWLTAYRPYFHV